MNWRIANDVGASAETVASLGQVGDETVLRAVHSFLNDIPGLVESFKFNVAVAKVMELVNVLRKAIDTGSGAGDPAVRFGAEEVAKVLSLFAPYTAEDMWQQLGKEPGVALAGFAQADEKYLVKTSLTAVVQVDGKLRDKFTVSPEITEAELRELAMNSDAVKRLISNREVANVIVRAPKLVNIALKPL